MSALDYLPHYTYEDLKIWEDNWEIIDGIAYAMSPSATISHQTIAFEIAFNLRSSIGDCERCLVIGEEDYVINDDTIVRPDVVLICNEPSTQYITKAPEIVVEVISKSTIKKDEGLKFELYEFQKVKYYVIAYPDELIAKVYKLKNHAYILEGEFSNETYEFEGTTCPALVDFENVFKRFKKK
jgi:Uma2 family endonuclease